MLKEFKDEIFETQIKNEDVSCIQFSATWCAPCKTLKPVMEKLSNEFKGNFYLADIEEGGINTASIAGVRGVPTVIIYKKGIEVDRKVGGVPESHMRDFLEKNISTTEVPKEETVSTTEVPKEETVSTTEAPKEETVSTTEAPKE
jgi:thioredoxin 1